MRMNLCWCTCTCVGLARTVYIHRIWPYIWWFPCQKYRMCTVYIWFWPNLHMRCQCCRFAVQFPAHTNRRPFTIFLGRIMLPRPMRNVAKKGNPTDAIFVLRAIYIHVTPWALFLGTVAWVTFVPWWHSMYKACPGHYAVLNINWIVPIPWWQTCAKRVQGIMLFQTSIGSFPYLDGKHVHGIVAP